MGEGVYDLAPSPSSHSVLWSELFKEKERKFLQKHLGTHTVHFTESPDIFVISLRHLMQETFRRQSYGAVVCVHPTAGAMTSSWAWGKLLYPLFKAGLSTILIDLPGFGVSGLNGNFDKIPVSRWLESDWKILMKALDVVPDGSRTANIVTCGDGCNAAIRMIQRHPFPNTRQVWHNPALDLDRLFPVTVAPGAGAEARQAAHIRQLRSLRHLLAGGKVRVWVTYDETCPPQHVKVIEELDVHTMGTTRTTRLRSCHICEAQAGLQVKVRVLYLGRQLKSLYTAWLRGDQMQLPTTMPDPALTGDDTTDSESSYQGDLSVTSTPTRARNPALALSSSASAPALPGLPARMQPQSLSTIGEATLLPSASSPTLADSSTMPRLVLPTLQQHQQQFSASTGKWRVGSQAGESTGRSSSSVASNARHLTEEASRLHQLRDPEPYRERLVVNVKVKSLPQLDAPVPDFFTEDETEQEKTSTIDALDASMRLHLVNQKMEQAGQTVEPTSRKERQREDAQQNNVITAGGMILRPGNRFLQRLKTQRSRAKFSDELGIGH